MYKIVFLCLLLALSTSSATAQQTREERKEAAAEALQDLKKGVLLLRLQSYDRKKKFLEKRFADKRAAEARKLYAQQLQELEAEQLKWNTALGSAVADLYDYSEVYHIYDTSMYALQAGNYEGRIFHPSGEPVDPDSLEGQPLFVLARIASETERAISSEGLAIWRLDKPGYPIAPFPYFSKLRYRLFTPMTPEVVSIAYRRAMRRWISSLERAVEAKAKK